MATMVDPPEGWRYGFPKELPPDVDFREWLLESGYPESEVDFAMQYVRQWETSDG